MSEGAFHGLSRYHSAPSSFLAGLTADDLFHVSSDPNARNSQALLASLFSEDFAPALPQQPPAVGTFPLPTNPHLLQPFPLQLPNPLGSSGQTLACESAQFSSDNGMASEDLLCENKSWNSQQIDIQGLINSTSSHLPSLSPVAAGAVSTPPPSSSWLPLTPPKTAIMRQSSSPATFLNQVSGEFHMRAMPEFSHRARAPLSVDYELKQPFLREESSDELDGDSPGQSAQQSFHKKRSFSDISQHLGSVSEIAGSSDLSIEVSAGLLPSNTTPCLARAKRGCATHPRSISERLRRTRISKGIKKLQELVPNMDKQVNTADMLDEAVEYIKHLQKQVEELSKTKAIHPEVKSELNV